MKCFAWIGLSPHRWLATLSLAALGFGEPQTPPPVSSSPLPSGSDVVQHYLNTWQFDHATKALNLIVNPIEREMNDGVVSFYSGDYTRAQKLLSRAVASGMLTAKQRDRAQHYLSLARGSEEVIGDGIRVLSPNGRVEAIFSDTKDTILAPYLFRAMSTAMERLEAELGVTHEQPVRFEFLSATGDLAKVSSLTLDNIYTTGTVGITKYRRVLMVTPRVMLYGYGWIDTAVHEYVHYLVTLRTDNRAPVWLQEGLAKLFEAKWRSADFVELSNSARYLLKRAIEDDTLVTFEEMSPSVAMLPTQERAALAYAQVETMLWYLLQQRGPNGLSRLLDEVGKGTDATEALAQAWGGSFEQFHDKWKQATAKRVAGARESSLGRIEFLDEEEPDAHADLRGDVFSHLRGGEAQQHARLGVLLTIRGHRGAAVKEYERARTSDRQARSDPRLAHRLGDLYLEFGQHQKAAQLLTLAAEGDPDNPDLAASQTTALRMTGQNDLASEAAQRVLRTNPFIPSVHCDLAELEIDRVAAAAEAAQCRQKVATPAR